MKDLSFFATKDPFVVGDTVTIDIVEDYADGKNMSFLWNANGIITDIHIYAVDMLDITISIETECPCCGHKELRTFNNRDKCRADIEKHCKLPERYSREPIRCILFCDYNRNGDLFMIRRRKNK